MLSPYVLSVGSTPPLCGPSVRGGCVHVCTQMCTSVYTVVYTRVHTFALGMFPRSGIST